MGRKSSKLQSGLGRNCEILPRQKRELTEHSVVQEWVALPLFLDISKNIYEK
jgi:hypothetical protein